MSTAPEPGEGAGIGGQFTRDHDAAAFVVGTVEVDTVVVNLAVGAVTVDADTAAVFRREVAADVVVGHLVVVGLWQETDAVNPGWCHRWRRTRLWAITTFSLWLLVPGSQAGLGVPMRNVP
ncbi:MAG: hypothetical protein R2856_27015 [Caldilineaceae bacterium]